MHKTIVVTGCAGFVGSNLCETLLQQDHTVIGIDNFSYGSKNNMKSFIDSKNFTFHESDLVTENIVSNIPCDFLVHLASQKIPRYTSAYKTIRDNDSMIQKAIDACLKHDAKLIFSSTSDIYGKNPDLPYNEESNSVLGPTTVKRWAYATSKIHSEHLILANHEENDLKYTIMRFFGSYGKNQNLTWWGGPQSVFAQNIMEGKKIEVHGDGLQTRTFTYIDDTIQGVMKCIFHENSMNDIFNIANEPDEEVTIKELANIVCSILNVDPKDFVDYIPYETFGKYEDVMRRVPDISKIKSKLGFIPKYGLDQGLQRTIAWQKTL